MTDVSDPSRRAVLRAQNLVEHRLNEKGSRRTFLRMFAGATAATAASGCGDLVPSFDDFFQKHYRELGPEEKAKAFARFEQRTEEKSGVAVTIGDPRPIPGVKFVYALDLSLCNGSRRCVEACARENNLPDDIRYIRVLEMKAGTFDVEHGDHYYDPPEVPRKGRYYLPVQCQQCENPPCVKACPTSATWKESDGIVVVDYEWCIGCRYCEAACPYLARRFNFSTPSIAPDRINPDQGYLSNRIRPVGVVEKCTYCLQRTRKGRYPACLEACPTGARKFGDINDPNSEVRRIMETKRVYVLKEELGTMPQFFYFFS